MNDSFILAEGTVILPDGDPVKADVIVRDGLVHSILSEGSGASRPPDLPVLDCADGWILPGLVEMHIHGAFGRGFEALRGPEDLLEVAQRMEARGVSRFLPTVLWDRNVVAALVKAIRESGLYGSVIPGIYIEGPFVNPERRGGIGLAQITAPDADLCKEILHTADGMLRIMAVAPELPGVEQVYPLLSEAGILISLGHSAATAEVTLPPYPFSITHLFNAMSGLDHKIGGGGLANIALSGKPDWTELNADGIHVNPSAVKVASRALAPERLILTSDAVISAGLEHGSYLYFGKSVLSGTQGVRYRETGTLIGSNRLGMEIVKAYMAASGAGLAPAVAAMSRNPARAIGLDAGIRPGMPADLFIWDTELRSCRRPGTAQKV
jgi:N-acetylglucosamine-6-phosphate deacetylase